MCVVREQGIGPCECSLSSCRAHQLALPAWWSCRELSAAKIDISDLRSPDHPAPFLSSCADQVLSLACRRYKLQLLTGARRVVSAPRFEPGFAEAGRF